MECQLLRTNLFFSYNVTDVLVFCYTELRGHFRTLYVLTVVFGLFLALIELFFRKTFGCFLIFLFIRGYKGYKLGFLGIIVGKTWSERSACLASSSLSKC